MKCDVAVLGGGPAGYTAAIRAAQLGGKVVCIEEDFVAAIRAKLGQKVRLAASTDHHSNLTERTRERVWGATASGEARVVVGARSALFLPFATLGLVVVDEEHDGSFKQDEGVRYHGRDVALVRAIRLSIEAIDRRLEDAAATLGANRGWTFITVTLPLALPGLANLWLSLTKATALISVLGYSELTLATQQAAGASKHYFLFYFAALAIYLWISVWSGRLFKRLEENWGYSNNGRKTEG